MADENETTTTTEATSTTSTTTDNNGVDANVQTQEGAPELNQATPAQQEASNDLPNPAPVNAAPTTDLNASGSVASPAVEQPANDPTLNDVEQTQAERFADARSTAMANHAAAGGEDRLNQTSATEEEVA